MSRKTLLSGVKPTGRPHLGNYFGALKQFVELQDEYDSYYMIADLHALTTLHNANQLRENTISLAIDYLAIGIEPQKSTIFKQSDVSAHAELAWIFDCLVTVPFLERSHAYKDAVQEGITPTAGLLTYPMLQAADILLYSPDVVPVGKDQKQHVEYTRDAAEKFNGVFGEVFKLPEAMILEDVATVPGIDGKKMSKSYGNHIPLFAEEEELKGLIMSIVTDSKGVDEPKNPESDNVFALHKLFTPKEELELLRKRYAEGDIGYQESKEMLHENINGFLTPLRKKREEIAANREYVVQVLEEGSEKSRSAAEAKMREVREKVGLSLS